jgi:hypothetical protein
MENIQTQTQTQELQKQNPVDETELAIQITDPTKISQLMLNSNGIDGLNSRWDTLLSQNSLSFKFDQQLQMFQQQKTRGISTNLAQNVVVSRVEVQKTIVERITEKIVAEADTPKTSRQVLKDLTKVFESQQRQERLVESLIIANRGSITKTICGAVVAGVMAYGLFAFLSSAGVLAVAASAASSGFGVGFGFTGFPMWFQTLWVVAKFLGYDKKAIEALFRSAKQSQLIRSASGKRVIPPALGNLLSRVGVPDAILEATLETTLTTGTSEFLTLLTTPSAAFYAFNTTSSKLINSGVISASTNSAVKYIDQMRAMASKKNTAKIAQTFIETKNLAKTTIDQHLKMEKAVKLNVKETQLVESIDATITEETLRPFDPKPKYRLKSTIQLGALQKTEQNQLLANKLFSTSNVITTATVIGTTVALGLFQGQVSSTALTSLAENTFVRNTAFSLIVSQTKLADFIGKFGGRLTSKTLSALHLLEKPLLDANASPEQRTGLLQKFFGLLLGQEIYSDQQISAMNSVEEIKNILIRNGVKKELFPKGESSVEIWRKALLHHQQEVLSITQQELVSSLTENMLKGAASAGLVQGANLVYQNYGSQLLESINNNVLSTAAGLTKEEIAAVNLHANDPAFVQAQMSNPTISSLKPQTPQESGIHKLKTFQKENSFLFDSENTSAAKVPVSNQAVLVETATQGPDLNKQQRDLLKQVRVERQAQRELMETLEATQKAVKQQELISKYATKFKLSTEQVQGIKNMQDLQQAIRTQTSTGISSKTAVETAREIEYGNLTSEQLLGGKDLHDRLMKMEYTPIYQQLKGAAARAAAAQTGWLEQATSLYNQGIETLHLGRDTYNFGNALNKIFRVNEALADNAPFIDFGDFTPVANLGDALANLVGANEKENYGKVFLQAITEKIVKNSSTTEFLMNLAGKLAGSNAAQQDADAVAKIYNQLKSHLPEFL